MTQARVKERRNSVRVPGSYPVQLCDAHGRALGRGRTANISEQGVFVLLPGGRTPTINQAVRLTMELPLSPDRQRSTRTVRYLARVARVEPMGQWQGVALELVEKIRS